MLWETVTLYPGYTYLVSDVLWITAAIVALVFALRRFA